MLVARLIVSDPMVSLVGLLWTEFGRRAISIPTESNAIAEPRQPMRSVKSGRYCPGFVISLWITLIAAITSSLNTTVCASMFSFSCARLVAPMMVEATNQRE